MESIVFRDYLYISPKNLQKNDLVEIAERKYKTYNNSKIGIIMRVNAVIPISEILIQENGSGKVYAEIEVERFLPKIGDAVKAKVELIFQHGVFCRVDKRHLLVPSEQLTKYGFLFTGNTYVNNKRTIEQGTTITAIIKNIKFNGEYFNCVCDLDKNQICTKNKFR